MRHLLVPLLFAALTLAACTSDQVTSTVDTTCNSLDLADAGFQYYAANHTVNASIMRAEADDYAAGKAACANRSGNTMKIVTAALVATANAEAKAKAN